MSDLPTTHETTATGSPFLELLRRRSWILVLAIVVLGLVPRLGRIDWWINPDEGIYRSIVHQPTFAAAWRELSTNAHPPLYSAILWAMSKVSGSAVWLRMISLIAGLAAIAGVWLTARELVGVVGDLAAALVVALSPAAIELSQVMRPYMLQLALVSFGLWGLAVWYRDRQRGLVRFAVCMSLAVLTHYSSFPIVGVVLLLLGIGVALHKFERPDLIALAKALAPLLLIMVVLYVVHVRPNMMGSAMQEEAREGWLKPYFVHGPGDMWIGCLGLMRYLFGTSMAAPAVAVVLAGIVLGVVRERVAAFAVFAMLIVAILTSAVGIYPFGGTRHSIYLLVFVALGVGLAVETVVAAGATAMIASSVVLAGLVVVRTGINTAIGADSAKLLLPHELVTPPEKLASMMPPLDNVRDSDGIVVMSQQTYYCLQPLLGRYMGKPASEGRAFYVFRWGKRNAIVAGSWDLTISGKRIDEPSHLYTFLRTVDQARPELRVFDQAHIWMLFAGWLNPLVFELQAASRMPEYRGLVTRGKAVSGVAVAEIDLRRFRQIIEHGR